ncbi:SDR family oxidoreductase [Salisediminibacterium selenitireducens]|uniref:NmrA family protein n=1 Tax=Bacillus selenitireducens (strain ATCC 700615 / DSM 15326 / MLS10) TaxID=439292 RepID=D6XYA4_BACIE|nr:SDR family oxidoreductase [Salisediminibacterium selenitireducens]ADI00173.1 NmrA family protein [[Bacillus] selenitireducens MLS10]
MPMKQTFFITGATGNIGSYVAQELAEVGHHVKAGIRQPEHTGDQLMHEHIEAVSFNFLKPDSFHSALNDTDGVLLIRPPQLANPEQDMLPFINAAKEAGISRIVFVSLLGVERNPFVPHRKIEQFIRSSGINYTFLRPSFFMQNLTTTHRSDIAIHKLLDVPVGKALTSFIDTRDIASVAAVCLTSDLHQNKSYTLTGNRAIGYDEMANTLSHVLEIPIEYQPKSPAKFRKRLIFDGTPKAFANVMTLLYLMTWAGTAKKTTRTVQDILQREPIAFDQFVLDHKAVWIKE